jgi:hypothetical protein
VNIGGAALASLMSRGADARSHFVPQAKCVISLFMHGGPSQLDLLDDKPGLRALHVHDLNATLLHLLGVDHRYLIYRFQGRDYRLTDVAGKVVKEILA